MFRIETATVLTDDELPLSFSNREPAHHAVVHKTLPQVFRFGLAQQRGHETEAVLGGIARNRNAEKIGTSGEHIVEGDELAALAACFHVAGPACQERHAMAAFVNLGLLPPERTVDSMTFDFRVVDALIRFHTAIVA